mmetsp:Transcript_757/g.1783  ORF Transcript_757/g.1783 Transcript_757/m.1783 type:complete len:97 (+) Transcript_757:178-468(+)
MKKEEEVKKSAPAASASPSGGVRSSRGGKKSKSFNRMLGWDPMAAAAEAGNPEPRDYLKLDTSLPPSSSGGGGGGHDTGVPTGIPKRSGRGQRRRY